MKHLCGYHSVAVNYVPTLFFCFQWCEKERLVLCVHPVSVVNWLAQSSRNAPPVRNERGFSRWCLCIIGAMLTLRTHQMSAIALPFTLLLVVSLQGVHAVGRPLARSVGSCVCAIHAHEMRSRACLQQRVFKLPFKVPCNLVHLSARAAVVVYRRADDLRDTKVL